MALYEYKCPKCGRITSFLEKISSKDSFLTKLKRRCKNCGSHKLVRIFSTFTAIRQESTADMFNEISRMGPVNFVPDHRPLGPPPGGCPYAKQANSDSSDSSRQNP